MRQLGQAGESKVGEKKEDGDEAMPWCSRVSNLTAFCNPLVVFNKYR